MTFLASNRPGSYFPTLILPFFKSLTFSIRLILDRDPDLCLVHCLRGESFAHMAELGSGKGSMEREEIDGPVW